MKYKVFLERVQHAEAEVEFEKGIDITDLKYRALDMVDQWDTVDTLIYRLEDLGENEDELT